MRHFFSTLIVFWGLAVPAVANDAKATVIETIITDQIAAFQADDFSRAFSFASPTIKDLFGTPESFGKMVRRGYPMVYRPSSVRMLGLREVEGRLLQRVMVIDQAGATHLLDYEVVETLGGWQINAVQLLPQSGVGV